MSSQEQVKDSYLTPQQALARAINSGGDDRRAVATVENSLASGKPYSTTDLVDIANRFPTHKGRRLASQRIGLSFWTRSSDAFKAILGYGKPQDTEIRQDSEEQIHKLEKLALKVKIPFLVFIITAIVFGVWELLGTVPVATELFWFSYDVESSKNFTHLPFAVSRWAHLVDFPIYAFVVVVALIESFSSKLDRRIKGGPFFGLLLGLLIGSVGGLLAGLTAGLSVSLVTGLVGGLIVCLNRDFFSVCSYLAVFGLFVSVVFGPAIGIPFACLSILVLLIARIGKTNLFGRVFSPIISLSKSVGNIAVNGFKWFVGWLRHWP